LVRRRQAVRASPPAQAALIVVEAIPEQTIPTLRVDQKAGVDHICLAMLKYVVLV
jgi:hypothetical protein